jgi:hypothetical protein
MPGKFESPPTEPGGFSFDFIRVRRLRYGLLADGHFGLWALAAQRVGILLRACFRRQALLEGDLPGSTWYCS